MPLRAVQVNPESVEVYISSKYAAAASFVPSAEPVIARQPLLIPRSVQFAPESVEV